MHLHLKQLSPSLMPNERRLPWTIHPASSLSSSFQASSSISTASTALSSRKRKALGHSPRPLLDGSLYHHGHRPRRGYDVGVRGRPITGLAVSHMRSRRPLPIRDSRVYATPPSAIRTALRIRHHRPRTYVRLGFTVKKCSPFRFNRPFTTRRSWASNDAFNSIKNSSSKAEWTTGAVLNPLAVPQTVPTSRTWSCAMEAVSTSQLLASSSSSQSEAGITCKADVPIQPAFPQVA